ncbi:MAG: polysaccharide biosynthesis tyrosine autokinase [Acidobacteria bacterium]|nr:polysaccharide biosynthesis tyrosine autokinase [Acidobacteriota bacterium]
MTGYIVRRVLGAVLVMWAVATLGFFMLRIVPGDPIAAMLFDAGDAEAVEQLRHKLGLDQPVFVQYAKWLWYGLQGDFGNFVWTVVVLLLVFWVLSKYAWGPLLGALQGREDFIRSSLEQAKGTLYAYTRRSKRKAAAAIPHEAPELIPHRRPHSTASEAYRAVRTSLLLSLAGGVRMLTVSSALPGEGKTVTSCNMAVVLAQLGKKTLLIDGDLHRPRLHKIFRLSTRRGLSTVLAEGEDPASLIQPTIVPNLFMLPSGPEAPNPSSLFSSPEMEQLLAWCRANYEYVVIDTPPITPITDAVLIGTLTDGVLLTIHAGKSPREAIAHARDKLLRSNVRILGAVLNNLVLEPDDAYYYGAGGYYGYGEEERGSVAKVG